MGISIWQILIIVAIVVLLFGANKIPRLMGDVAKGVRNFKTGLKEGQAPPEETKTINQDATPTASQGASSEASVSPSVNKDEAAKS
jgi:sec-independent protein translocase protein TatA